MPLPRALGEEGLVAGQMLEDGLCGTTGLGEGLALGELAGAAVCWLAGGVGGGGGG